jgi:hypothetical protein
MLDQDPAQVFPEHALEIFCAQKADLSLGYRYLNNGLLGRI